MNQHFRFGAAIAAALAMLAMFGQAANALAWPEKPVRIVIPWPPGGSTDIIGRMLAADLTQRLKQQFVIDNRAGAGSIIGLQHAMAQPPDGYTLMMTSTAYGFLIDKPKVPVDLVNSGDRNFKGPFCISPNVSPSRCGVN